MWLAEKPSFRAASCCNVDVVKGGGGFFEKGLVSTDETVKMELENVRKKVEALFVKAPLN